MLTDPIKNSRACKLSISCCPFWIYAMLWIPKWAYVVSSVVSQSFPDDSTWKVAQTPKYILPLAMEKSIYNLIMPSTHTDIKLM